MHVTSVKYGKTHASEAWLGLVLYLIGWESGVSFINQSQSVVMWNQSKKAIYFDSQLKTAPTDATSSVWTSSGFLTDNVYTVQHRLYHYSFVSFLQKLINIL